MINLLVFCVSSITLSKKCLAVFQTLHQIKERAFRWVVAGCPCHQSHVVDSPQTSLSSRRARIFPNHSWNVFRHHTPTFWHASNAFNGWFLVTFRAVMAQGYKTSSIFWNRTPHIQVSFATPFFPHQLKSNGVRQQMIDHFPMPFRTRDAQGTGINHFNGSMQQRHFLTGLFQRFVGVMAQHNEFMRTCQSTTEPRRSRHRCPYRSCKRTTTCMKNKNKKVHMSKRNATPVTTIQQLTFDI